MATSRIRGEESRMQKLVIILSVSSFLMFVIVVVLSWYVFDYSSKRNQMNVNANLQKIVDEKKVFPDEANNIDSIEKELKATDDLSAEAVAEMLSRHMLLTEGEVTVATIINVEGLKMDYPEIFQYAKNGDKLLFYQLGIIIYDPVLDKIVDVMRRLPEGVYIPNSVFDENLF